MSSSKIKNIILLVLLCVNAVLLILVASDRARAAADAREALNGAVAVLESRGIAVSADASLRDDALPVRTVTRDLDAEKRSAVRVLGHVTVQDQGGYILFYNGEKGQAVFRGTGVFEILMNEGEVPTGSDAVATARAFLRRLGLSAVRGSGSAESDVSDGSGTVRLRCRTGGTEVLGCQVTFTFTNGSLLLVVGTRPLEVSSSAASAQTPLDVPTVLMRFLSIVTEGGRVCSELQDLELCYMQTATVSGTGTLTPVWRVTTDTGEFYINGLTGKQETVS